MKSSDVQVVDNNNDNRYKKLIWIVVMTVIIAISAHMAFMATWGGYNTYKYYYFIPAVIAGIAFSAVVYCLKHRFPWIRILLLVPLISMFVPAGLTGGINGARIWIDIMVYSWNKAHEGGLALFSITGGNMDMVAFAIFMSIVIGELAFWFASSGAVIQCELFIVFWVVIQVISGNIYVLSCSMLIAAGIILAATGKDFYLTFRSAVMSVIIFAAFCMAALLSTDEIKSVRDTRNYIHEQIDDMRYGVARLPEGDVGKASELKNADGTMLTVWSGQEKNLYLKGYVGVNYNQQTGRWRKLADSAYGGDNYGMLDWLYNNGFNPLTQSATYYSLSERQDKPEINSLRITVDKATRDYVYVPASADTFVYGRIKSDKDMRYAGKGLSGSSQYELNEVSGSRPAELMIAEDWLTQPHSQEQQQYVEAEAVYRDFVYDNYTSETREYYNLMNDIFWKDYESQIESVYGAVSRVREVLGKYISYSDNLPPVPDGKDPLEYYITEAGQGNAVVYASAAVFALRTYGIPARYVEGYYVASSDLAESSDGEVVVDGSNAHAWVEVYFDGIGWQPVDVTPGYYYEAAALQQMVNSPDNVHKTASVDEDKNSEAGKVIDNNSSSRTSDEIIRKVWNTGRIVLGIAAIVIIVLAVCISVLQIVYVILGMRRRKIYSACSSADKARILDQYIYKFLKVKGINATLGWNTEENDRIIAEKFKNIEPGDYSRVCVILEKVIYGNIELEGYELRTLEIFAKEIFTDYSGDSWRARIKSEFMAIKLYV